MGCRHRGSSQGDLRPGCGLGATQTTQSLGTVARLERKGESPSKVPKGTEEDSARGQTGQVVSPAKGQGDLHHGEKCGLEATVLWKTSPVPGRVRG